jgi:hypothetical protein
VAVSDHHFNTPPDFLERVRVLDAENGIGLDPCSNPSSMVAADLTYDAVTNGLDKSWRGHGLVFMNPPHSMSPHNIEPWMEKAHREFNLNTGPLNDQFVGLIPAKPDTAWFHEHVRPFPLKCFLRGRPKFWLNGEPTKGPGKFPSMVIYQGKQRDLFRELFSELGWVVG